MTDFSWIPYLLWGIVGALGFWPGSEPARPLEPPKRGYWTIATVFWPVRRAYGDLWPHHAALAKGQRSAWAIGFYIAALSSLLIDIFHVTALKSPEWVMVQVGGVAFFLGRASGFWSADRRIIKAGQVDEATEAKAPL
jgi:hypothetical protein